MQNELQMNRISSFLLVEKQIKSLIGIKKTDWSGKDF